MAEREGFEPSVGVNLHTLSKRAPSTTRPPLRLTNNGAGKMEQETWKSKTPILRFAENDKMSPLLSKEGPGVVDDPFHIL